MISRKTISTLTGNDQFKKFLDENIEFEILHKNIKENEIERIIYEYPKFFYVAEDIQKIRKKKKISSIICFTLVKCDISSNNYSNLKKIKFYIDEFNNKILRILQN